MEFSFVCLVSDLGHRGNPRNDGQVGQDMAGRCLQQKQNRRLKLGGKESGLEWFDCDTRLVIPVFLFGMIINEAGLLQSGFTTILDTVVEILSSLLITGTELSFVFFFPPQPLVIYYSLLVGAF
jgi:hypothetical protein